MSNSGGVGTSELIDLLLSFVVLTVAFSMVGGGLGSLNAERLVIVAVAVGTGFMLHELAHKFVAQRYGYWAEYKASMFGLILTVVMALAIGIVFAAPGAVMIRKTSYSSPQSTYNYETDDAYWDRLERKTGSEDLWISLAGPITNIILVAFFFALLMSGLLTTSLFIGVPYQPDARGVQPDTHRPAGRWQDLPRERAGLGGRGSADDTGGPRDIVPWRQDHMIRF
jgi:Zn-dependent protease